VRDCHIINLPKIWNRDYVSLRLLSRRQSSVVLCSLMKCSTVGDAQKKRVELETASPGKVLYARYGALPKKAFVVFNPSALATFSVWQISRRSMSPAEIIRDPSQLPRLPRSASNPKPKGILKNVTPQQPGSQSQ